MARAGFQIKATLKGDAVLRLALAAVAAKAPRDMERALEAEGDTEMEEMVERTPVLAGDLRRTAQRFPAEWHGRHLSVLIRMGGPEAPYAVKQHMNKDYIHPRGGQNRYMSSVVREARKFMATRVGRRLDIV